MVSSREATHRDLESMLNTLVPAFAEDPVWGDWAFPDRPRSTLQRRALFKLWLEGALQYSTVRVTTGCEAVAVWYPPAGTGSSPQEQRDLASMARALLHERADIFLQGSEMLEAAHPHDEPHYYLALIGTDVRHRGHGIGTALLRDNLAWIDAQGMPAYLESTHPKNIARYERLGFRKLGAIRLPDEGPLVERMWRPGGLAKARPPRDAQ